METPTGSTAPESKGPMVAIIIIILILVIGSIYAISKNRPGDAGVDTDITTGTSTEPQTIDEIEADTQADVLTDIEADFNDLEREVNQ